MARKKKKAPRRTARARPRTPQARALEAFHQIWLAGLGAVSKAQRGAPQLLEDLIAEGARVHAQTRGAAEQALRSAVGEIHSAVNARVGEMRGQAAETLDNLEKIFQTRVHRALTKIGVPSAEEVETLSRRVETLNANIDKLARKAASRGLPNAVKRVTPAPLAAP